MAKYNIFNSCDKSYLYQSSLKKHMLVCHPEFYRQALQDSNRKLTFWNDHIENEATDILDAEVRNAPQNPSNDAVGDVNLHVKPTSDYSAGVLSSTGEAQKAAGGDKFR